MIRNTGPIALAAVLGLLLLAVWQSSQPIRAQDKPPPAVPKWEYKIVLPDNVEDPQANQTQFDKLGAEGWELSAAHSSTRRRMRRQSGSPTLGSEGQRKVSTGWL